MLSRRTLDPWPCLRCGLYNNDDYDHDEEEEENTSESHTWWSTGNGCEASEQEKYHQENECYDDPGSILPAAQPVRDLTPVL